LIHCASSDRWYHLEMPVEVVRSRRERSHAKILRVAARLVREAGFDGAGVDRVMGAAGLTRGGFYAHFDDKDAMLAEALDAAFVESRRNLFERSEAQGAEWLAQASRAYLSRSHVDQPGAGCSVPALAGEVARSGPKVRGAFARNVKGVLDQIARRLAGGEPTPEIRRLAIQVFVRWVGALGVARSVDPALGDEILAATAADLANVLDREAAAGDQRAVTASEAPKSSDALPASTRERSSSRRPARARTRTSRSQA
jgi:TetR/AcrR family transcriptional repressor of nem operon